MRRRHSAPMKIDYDARYAVCGGLASLAHQYETTRVNLEEVGKRVGFSRQTVWNDIHRHLGRVPVIYVAPKVVNRRGKATFQELLDEVRWTDPEAATAYTQQVIQLCEHVVTSESAARVHLGRIATILHIEKADESLSQVRIVRRGTRDTYTRLKVGTHCSIYQTVHFIIYGMDNAVCVSIPGKNLSRIRTLALPNLLDKIERAAARFGGVVIGDGEPSSPKAAISREGQTDSTQQVSP